MNEVAYYNKTNYSYYWFVSLEMKALINDQLNETI